MSGRAPTAAVNMLKRSLADACLPQGLAWWVKGVCVEARKLTMSLKEAAQMVVLPFQAMKVPPQGTS
jgi:hypothetical protein